METVPVSPDEVVRILLVEDDLDDVFIVKRALRDASVPTSLHRCAHGAEALTHLDARKKAGEPDYDLVLLDLNMPVMSGTEFLTRIRSDGRFSDLPIVVLTTAKDKDVLDEAVALGANAANSKASSFEAMCDIVQSIVDVWSGTIWKRAHQPL